MCARKFATARFTVTTICKSCFSTLCAIECMFPQRLTFAQTYLDCSPASTVATLDDSYFLIYSPPASLVVFIQYNARCRLPAPGLATLVSLRLAPTQQVRREHSQYGRIEQVKLLARPPSLITEVARNYRFVLGATGITPNDFFPRVIFRHIPCSV